MTTKPTATCRIDVGLMEELREYSKITGVPTNRCVEEAVARWLVSVAPARLEVLRDEKRKNALEKDLNLRHAKDREQRGHA